MENLIGKITAELIEKETVTPDGLAERININICSASAGYRR
jgi:ribosomal protein S25